MREIMYATTRKGLISRAYSFLLCSVQDHTLLKSRARWVTDIGAIDGDQWNMALEALPAVSVSAVHKLSQLFILHRAYRTPDKLYGWGQRDSPLCSKCSLVRGDFIHMIWHYPKLAQYRAEIVQVISDLA